MARQELINGETLLSHRTKLNSMTQELYDFDATVIHNFDTHILHVSKNGNDTTGVGTIENPYLTIAKALSTITDNSETIRYAIHIHPGIYQEANPLNIKSYVTLVGIGDVRLTPNTVSSDMITFDAFGTLENITIYGVTGAAAISGTTNAIIIRDLVVINCQTGITFNNASGRLDVYGAIILTSAFTMGTVIESLAGLVNARNITVYPGSSVTTVVSADGANAAAIIMGISGQEISATNAFYANNGGSIGYSSAVFSNVVNGIRVNNNSLVRGVGFASDNSLSYDLLQEDVDSRIFIDGGIINFEKVSAQEWQGIQLDVLSSVEGDEGSITTGEKHVGTPESGSETVLGEGDSTTRGMLVYTYDGSFTDVTSAASSLSGSTFTFPTTINSGFYVAWNLIDSSTSDYKKFFGLKVLVNSAMVVGTGSYEIEYWNGSGWFPIHYMTTQGNSPYISRIETFAEQAEYQQVRFDSELSGINPPFSPENGPWMKNDPVSLGTNRYWIRFRITAPLTTSPTIEQIKLHTNRTEINSDGWVEYYGLSRPTRVLPIDFSMSVPATESNQQPTNISLYISDNIYMNRVLNGFRNDKTDLATINFLLPSDFDSSTTMLFIMSYRSPAAGDVVWKVNYAHTNNNGGSDLYLDAITAPTTGPNELEITTVDTITAGEVGKQHNLAFELDLSKTSAWNTNAESDLIWISIRRLGSDIQDTVAGDIAVVNTLGRYVAWNNGTRFIDT